MVHVIGSHFSAFNWIITGVTSSSLIVQLYLALLIVKASPSSMKDYRPYLLLICFWNVVATGVCLLYVPELLYPLSCIVVDGPIGLAGHEASLVALSVGLFAVVCGEFAQNLGLAYRFAMVQRNDAFRRVLTGWKFAFVYQLIAGLGAFVHTYFTVGAFSDAEGSRAYIENSEREVPPYDPNVTVVCMDSWPTEKIAHVIVLGLSELTATVVLCVSLSAGTFVSMRLIGKHLTAYTRKLNVQLTSLLILQFTVQLLLIATPLFGIMVQRVVFKNEGPKPFLGVLYVLAFSLYGYANALLTLIFVAPYRMRIVAHCSRIAEITGLQKRRIATKQVTVASTSVVSTGGGTNRRLPRR